MEHLLVIGLTNHIYDYLNNIVLNKANIDKKTMHIAQKIFVTPSHDDLAM